VITMLLKYFYRHRDGDATYNRRPACVIISQLSSFCRLKIAGPAIVREVARASRSEKGRDGDKIQLYSSSGR
jgi:hypothetical protein